MRLGLSSSDEDSELKTGDSIVGGLSTTSATGTYNFSIVSLNVDNTCRFTHGDVTHSLMADLQAEPVLGESEEKKYVCLWASSLYCHTDTRGHLEVNNLAGPYKTMRQKMITWVQHQA
jgi:hypothetical protein